MVEFVLLEHFDGVPLLLLLHFGGVWQLHLEYLKRCVPQQESEVGTVLVAHCVWTQDAVVGLYQRSTSQFHYLFLRLGCLDFWWLLSGCLVTSCE